MKLKFNIYRIAILIAVMIMALVAFLVNVIGIEREKALLREKALVLNDIQANKRFLISLNDRVVILKNKVPPRIIFENKLSDSGALVFTKLDATDYVKMGELCNSVGIPIKSLRGIKRGKRMVVEVII